MNKKAIQIIFRLVFIFNHVTYKLFLNFNDIMRIKKETFSVFLTLVYIKLHNYGQDNNEEDTKNALLSPFSSKVCLPTFVQLAHNTNKVFCKLFVTLLAYQACTKNSRDKL